MVKRTVLLVDDDLGILDMMTDVLELEGYNVVVAKDGRDAIDTLISLPENPSLIILDLMMPVFNGWEFLDFQRSHSRYAKIPVVICSAYVESARSIHAEGVISKPVQLAPLLGAVKSFCSA